MSPLPFALEENALARALRARREPYIDLTLSNPTAAGLPYEEEKILGALSRREVLRYQPHPRGLLSAREAVAEFCGVDPERIVLTSSTSEAYSLLFKLLCQPGDEVLAPEPSYPLFAYLTALESVRLVPYPLRWDGEWHLDPAALRLSDRTRALLVVSPGNPTGAYLKKAELAQLVRCPLICDEVFADYPVGDDSRRARSCGNDRVLTFTLSGLSKVAGLPQLKLAWCAVSGPGAEAALHKLELIADTYLSVNTPVQVAARDLLETRHSFQRALRSRLAANRAALQGARRPDASWDVLGSEGGWSAILSVPRSRSEEEWALALLEAGALAHPGYFFDFPPGSGAHLVVSLLPEPAEFARGVQILARTLG
ncbi:MAG: pyridoxal phosphate-dependent aminotransferase [Deltaproteobacteria bacterium]|nr:MAG: pyridoxal phosphate-dependent aminotransferase [Deltaproteobacteria bacterium]